MVLDGLIVRRVEQIVVGNPICITPLNYTGDSFLYGIVTNVAGGVVHIQLLSLSEVDRERDPLLPKKLKQDNNEQHFFNFEHVVVTWMILFSEDEWRNGPLPCIDPQLHWLLSYDEPIANRIFHNSELIGLYTFCIEGDH